MGQPIGGRHRRPEPVLVGLSPAPAGRPSKAGALWRLRPRSVRAKIVLLLAVPVVALMALWGSATVTEVRAAFASQQVAALDAPVRGTVANAAAALGAERTAAVRLLTPRSAADAEALTTAFASQTAATDTAVAAVRSGTAAAAVPIESLSPDLKTEIGAVLSDFNGLSALRGKVTGHELSAADAYDAYTTSIEAARTVNATLAEAKAANTAPTGTQLAAILGLAAILVSLPVSVRVGRGLVVELVGLRDTALELAGRRLPEAIGRLRAGGEVDLEAAAPLPAAGPDDDEVGQVAEALAVVQRAALEAAVERAEVISGVARIFLNLARRSQILVHRQLALLDAMERRVQDPAEVEDLFRLDHLATRMRRHAESLIILSGQAPGRGWRRPVPLVDVLRSAVAEVEDFARVDVHRMPPVHVAGAAVADLTHLVAELVENATVFSPPYARITVRAQREPAGCVIEVEDRGLGMGPAALAEANERLADARQADLFDSDRLGLFVVSRLARRHGVRVVLRPAANGGTTAELSLPESLLDAREPESVLDDPGTATNLSATNLSATTPSPAAPWEDPVPQEAAIPVVNGVEHSTWPAESRRAAKPVTIGENGLPLRVRQRNLAPQLRGDQPEPPVPDPEDDVAARSPEAVRATMAAMQQGWTLGRETVPDRKEEP